MAAQAIRLCEQLNFTHTQPKRAEDRHALLVQYGHFALQAGMRASAPATSAFGKSVIGSWAKLHLLRTALGHSSSFMGRRRRPLLTSMRTYTDWRSAHAD